MSYKSNFGDMSRGVANSVSAARSAARSKMQNIGLGLTTSLSSMFDGGFVGMSAEGILELKNYLTSYCNEIEDIIQGFDQTGDITSALKGDVQDAAYDYIAAIKDLLAAYVSTLKVGIAEADEAYNNFVAAGKSISSSVTDSASEIRSNASSVRLD